MDISVTTGQHAAELATGLRGVFHSAHGVSGRELELLCRQPDVAPFLGNDAWWTDVRYHGHPLYQCFVDCHGAVPPALEGEQNLS